MSVDDKTIGTKNSGKNNNILKFCVRCGGVCVWYSSRYRLKEELYK